jgi:hypothetical protein
MIGGILGILGFIIIVFGFIFGFANAIADLPKM